MNGVSNRQLAIGNEIDIEKWEVVGEDFVLKRCQRGFKNRVIAIGRFVNCPYRFATILKIISANNRLVIS
jgi:hypothetical protein